MKKEGKNVVVKNGRETVRREVFVDILRVLSIFLIILFHLLYEITREINLRPLGFVGVSLFFILSGYSLARNYSSLEKFSFKWFLKKILKIVSVYYVAIISVVLLFGKQTYSGNLLKNLLYHFLFIGNLSKETAYNFISPAWFLTPLVFLYLLFPYLNRLLKKYPFSIIIFFVIADVFRTLDGDYTSVIFLFFISEFCFGILFAHGNVRLALLSSLLSLFVAPVMIVPYIVFFLFSFVKDDFSGGIFRIIGNNTLVLFLYHEVIIKLFVNQWQIYVLDKTSSIILVFLIIVINIHLSKDLQKYINKKFFKHWRNLSK